MQTTATPITAPAPYTNPHTVLSGHTNQATAYKIDDHPYNPGSEVLCTKQFWVETASKGMKTGKMRVVTRTSNPSAGGTWNAPKTGTFFDLTFLFIDAETGDIQAAGINAGDIDEIATFKAEWYDILPRDLQSKLETIERETIAIDSVIKQSGAPAAPVVTPIPAPTPEPVVAPVVAPVIAPVIEPEPVEKTLEATPEPEVVAESEVEPATVDVPDPVQPQPVFSQVLTDIRNQAAGLEASLVNVPGKGYVLRYDNTDICDPTNLNAIQKLLNKQERALANSKDHFEDLVAKANAPKPAPRVRQISDGTKSDNYYKPQRAKGDEYTIPARDAVLDVRPNTKIAAMIDALKAGLAVAEIATVLSDDVDESKIQERVTKRGYGIYKTAGYLYLVEPSAATDAAQAS